MPQSQSKRHIRRWAMKEVWQISSDNIEGLPILSNVLAQFKKRETNSGPREACAYWLSWMLVHTKCPSLKVPPAQYGIANASDATSTAIISAIPRSAFIASLLCFGWI